MLDSDTMLTGHVVREERLEEDVKPLADAGRTAITMTTDVSGVTTLTVTPRDRYGNYFGPGYAPLVQAKVRSGGKLRNSIPDDPGQFGTYNFTIAGTPRRDTGRRCFRRRCSGVSAITTDETLNGQSRLN